MGTWSSLREKGGYGFRDNGSNIGVTVAGLPVAFKFNRRQVGYTIGLEYMFTQNWSGKLEYQYFNFSNSQFVAGPQHWLAWVPSAATSTPMEKQKTEHAASSHQLVSQSLVVVPLEGALSNRRRRRMRQAEHHGQTPGALAHSLR